MYERLSKRRGEQGFTLVELLVVIVILGVLAAVVVFSVTGLTSRGEDAAMKANIETLNSASRAYWVVQPPSPPAPAPHPVSKYAANIEDLETTGFLSDIPGTMAPDKLSYTVDNAGGKSYKVTYNPLTGKATGTEVPSPTTTTTTSTTSTTTTTLGPCTFVAGSAGPGTVYVDMAGGSTGGLNVDTGFSFKTTGLCNGPMSFEVTRPAPLGGTVAGEVTGFTATAGAQTTWAVTRPGNGGNGPWGNAAGTGSFIIKNGATTLAGPINLIFTAATPPPCQYTAGSLTGSPLVGGDLQIMASGAGAIITSPVTVTFAVTGYCENLQLGFDGVGTSNTNKFVTVTNFPAPAGGTFSVTIPLGDTGWGDGGADADEPVEIRENGGNLTVVNSAVDYIADPTRCTYSSGEVTPNVTLASNNSGPLNGSYTFGFRTTGICAGPMTMNLSNGQPTITGFTATTVGAEQQWTKIVTASEYTTWSTSNFVDVSIESNGIQVANGFLNNALNVIAGPQCTYVNNSQVTPDVTLALGNSGALNGSYTFSFRTTGPCTPGVLSMNLSNNEPTITGFTGAPAGPGVTQWTKIVTAAEYTTWATANGVDMAIELDGNQIANGGVFFNALNVIAGPTCTYQPNSQVTPDVTLAAGNNGPLDGSYVFSFRTTGPCTGAMSMNLSGSEPTLTGFTGAPPVAGVTQWTKTVTAAEYNWTAATGVDVDIQMDGSTITNGGTFFNLLDVLAPTCKYVAGSETTPNVTLAAGNSGALNGSYAFSFQTTGPCAGGSMTMNLSGAEPTITGFAASGPNAGVTTWSKTVAPNDYNWTAATGVDMDIQRNGNTITNGGTFFNVLDVIAGPFCTYQAGSEVTPNVTLAVGNGGALNGSYTFSFRTTGPCTGAMTMNTTGQPTIAGFTSAPAGPGVTQWTKTVLANEYNWTAANNVDVNIEEAGNPIVNGFLNNAFNVIAGPPVCTYSSLTLSPSGGGGDWQVNRNGSTGQLNNGGVTITVVTTNTALCTSISVSIPIPGGAAKVVTLTGPGGFGGNTWTKAIPTGTTGDSAGWGTFNSNLDVPTDIAVRNGATTLTTQQRIIDFV